MIQVEKIFPKPSSLATASLPLADVLPVGVFNAHDEIMIIGRVPPGPKEHEAPIPPPGPSTTLMQSCASMQASVRKRANRAGGIRQTLGRNALCKLACIISPGTNHFDASYCTSTLFTNLHCHSTQYCCHLSTWR